MEQGNNGMVGKAVVFLIFQYFIIPMFSIFLCVYLRPIGFLSRVRGGEKQNKIDNPLKLW
jgi:hypothetical protein